MLDKNSPIPLYYQLKEEIKKQIETGEIQAGDKLLSETEMMRKYGVGRLTTREALSQLVNEGYLEKQHGRGTFCKGNLSYKSQLNIDVLLNTSDTYFIPYYIRGVNEVLTDSNANFLIHDTRNDVMEIAVLLEKILQRGTSGIILQPSMKMEPLPDRLVTIFERLRIQKIPYFFIDSAYKGIESSFAVLDEVKGGYLAVEHLAQLGHQKIAGVFYESISDSLQRQQGFEQAASLHGVAVVTEWICDEAGAAYSEICLRIAGDKEITAVVCYNDDVAMKCIKYFEGQGLCVPSDISVIGYDDSYMALSGSVPLTTIAHPKEEMGKLVAEKLVGMVIGTIKWPFTYTFEPKLVIRESTVRAR